MGRRNLFDNFLVIAQSNFQDCLEINFSSWENTSTIFNLHYRGVLNVTKANMARELFIFFFFFF